MAAAHLFVADIDDPVIDDVDRHHAERVLRLRDGEQVTVSDGAGGVRECAFRAGAVLEPLGSVERSPAPNPAISIGFALVKGQRPEWVVQKLTECGVDRIVPFVAERSVVRWETEKASSHVERWQRIAREASMQSRRVWLPIVEDVATFAALVSRAAGNIALADPAGEPPTLTHTTVLVGPEGGWSDAERAAVRPKMRFGPHVLRAETAAIAAAVVLGGLRSRVVAAVEHGR